jgi:post-segregation antitoxin (ccd killing protein)
MQEQSMTTVEITLPDQLAEEAKRAGLLAPDAIERLVREAIRRRALTELKEAMDRMAAADGPTMTPEEIQEEIRAARAERRAQEARATGA